VGVYAAGAGLGIAQALRLDPLDREHANRCPRVSLTQLARPLPENGFRPTAALLCGCVMDVAFRDVQRDTLRAVAVPATARYGPGPEGAAAPGDALRISEAARQMARNRIAEFADAEVIIVNAAGCSNHMKTWGHLLKDDPKWVRGPQRSPPRA